jgi:type I restriction enzyme S subunit
VSHRLTTVPIAETVSKVSTCDPRTEFAGRLFEYIDIGLVNRETKRIEGSNRIAAEVAPSRARQIVKARDILVSTVRPNLNAVAQVPDDLEEAIASTGFTVLRPKESIIDARYLFQWVKSPQFVTRMVENATGANYPAVSDRLVKDSMIPLPPLDEQNRIAAILDKADALREKRQQAINKLDELLQSVFINMFGDPVTNPKQWKPGVLGDVIRSAKDGPHVSPLYSDKGVPFLSTRHIRPGHILWEDLKFISREHAAVHWQKCKPERGDVLYTKGGTTGLAKAIDFDREIAVWVHIALLKTNQDMVAPQWLEQMLNSSYCYRQSQEYTRGIANRDLGLTRMVKIKMYIPPLELQRTFAEYAAKLKVVESKQVLSQSKIESLFASLQERAFNGELFSGKATASAWPQKINKDLSPEL